MARPLVRSSLNRGRSSKDRSHKVLNHSSKCNPHKAKDSWANLARFVPLQVSSRFVSRVQVVRRQVLRGPSILVLTIWVPTIRGTCRGQR